MPERVDASEFTMGDLCDLAAEVKEAGAAEYGIVHRPNVGPDFQMAMASFGIDIYDEENARLQSSRQGLVDYYAWLESCVEKGAIPADMTTWNWDGVHAAFRGEEAFSKFHGIWNLSFQLDAFGIDPSDSAAYFDKITWINSPAGTAGGRVGVCRPRTRAMCHRPYVPCSIPRRRR